MSFHHSRKGQPPPRHVGEENDEEPLRAPDRKPAPPAAKMPPSKPSRRSASFTDRNPYLMHSSSSRLSSESGRRPASSSSGKGSSGVASMPAAGYSSYEREDHARADWDQKLPAKQGYSAKDYAASDKKGYGPGKAKGGDTVSLGQFDATSDFERQVQLSMQPGAVNIPGAMDGSRPPMHSPTHSYEEEGRDQDLVDAYLVNEHDEGGRSNRPPNEDDQVYDAKAVEVKPWYKRPPVLIALGLLLCAVIGVTLGVTLTRSSGSGDSTPTQCAEPVPAQLTIVIQLDEKPIETGWRLECDCLGEVQNVPQGSYAFVPIGILIPSYRLEVTSDVVTGDTCLFTITDAGLNGLNGGFYEVYYGDDVGIPEFRLDRGTPLGASQTIQVQVVAPPTPEPTPTAAPVPTSPQPTPVCSVCVDGSPLPNTSVTVSETSQTCGELEQLASTINNSTECSDQVQQFAETCGCNNFCTTVCPDGSALEPNVEDTLVRVENGRRVTCGDMQNRVMNRNSSITDCNSAFFVGEKQCSCPPSGMFCNICQGGTLPQNATRHIIPGVACSDISGIAYTLLRGDPRFGVICPACLSIGEYCGCPEPEMNPRSFCRMCGDRLLPVPDKIIYSPFLGFNTTCFHVEFAANLGVFPNGTTNPEHTVEDCSVIQVQNGEECCNAVEA